MAIEGVPDTLCLSPSALALHILGTSPWCLISRLRHGWPGLDHLPICCHLLSVPSPPLPKAILYPLYPAKITFTSKPDFSFFAHLYLDATSFFSLLSPLAHSLPLHLFYILHIRLRVYFSYACSSVLPRSGPHPQPGYCLHLYGLITGGASLRPHRCCNKAGGLPA